MKNNKIILTLNPKTNLMCLYDQHLQKFIPGGSFKDASPYNTSDVLYMMNQFAARKPSTLQKMLDNLTEDDLTYACLQSYLKLFSDEEKAYKDMPEDSGHGTKKISGKRRGRPAKMRDDEPLVDKVKKPRGRPRRSEEQNELIRIQNLEKIKNNPTRRRGRPKKIINVSSVAHL